MRRLGAGWALACATFTVAPVRAARVDRGTAGVAMTVAPVVGALLGAVLGATLLVAARAWHAPLVAGAVTAALGVLLTRGLHLDGLADTVDALGSYRRGAAGLAVMRQADIGPFGVAAVALVLLTQAAALAATAGRPAGAVLAGVAAVYAAGRLAATWACRRGVPAARPDGLGALVAGTVSRPAAALATLPVLAVAGAAVPGRWWQGPLAVLAALTATGLLRRHAVRRFGGITGDVLGAAVECAATLTLLGLLAGG
ncbi:MAG TPA: adenosylcobinamide-GDP ribazoletransferase [Pilimelia sp.]|nr:adenosylcobinamide-GDP ribazoletransferase [Pilimelia sp.]